MQHSQHFSRVRFFSRGRGLESHGPTISSQVGGSGLGKRQAERRGSVGLWQARLSTTVVAAREADISPLAVIRLIQFRTHGHHLQAKAD